MFRGSSSVALDSKGRLAIPARYREAILAACNGSMVITLNNTKERCLWLYTIDEWTKVEHKIVELPSFNPEHQKLKRFVVGHANDVDMDSSGRILLPAHLREFASMDKTAFIIGQGNKFEIWSKDQWIAKQAEWLEEPLDPSAITLEMEQLSI
ncbi:MAG: division/cell wall cluster transcriptional repressor MraZ [Gammaproteobacteria bacterium]|nr:division/cell wall cluster transcriptional repressor MraZ [Gammaproteobacteria bacterium]MCY4313394.1 division/cell wall cluster transcriptional repressor MraZ [Gammaproteobacteria bacterium]